MIKSWRNEIHTSAGTHQELTMNVRCIKHYKYFDVILIRTYLIHVQKSTKVSNLKNINLFVLKFQVFNFSTVVQVDQVTVNKVDFHTRLY